MVTNSPEYFKQYYQKNKEYLKAYQRNYYHTNKDKLRENYNAYSKDWGKAYYYKNKERIAEYRKQYYQQNKKRIIARQKEIIQMKRLGLPIVRKSKYMDEHSTILKPKRKKKDISPSIEQEEEEEEDANEPIVVSFD